MRKKSLSNPHSPIPHSPIPHSPRIIGLTGGISTGKTTVSNYLANTYHLPVLDADIYAREAVSSDSPLLQHIVNRYGLDILFPDGTLHRSQLGNIIFANPSERLWLEQLIHPYVRHHLQEKKAQLLIDKYPIIVLVIPLLFEAEMTDLVTEIWVVRCSLHTQLSRLMERDRLTLAQAEARINSQKSIEDKCARADVILDNSYTLQTLLKQVDELMVPKDSC